MSVPDLIAYEGLEFGENVCKVCGLHLEIDGFGKCMLCITKEDFERSQLMAFDPELSDILAGRGSELVW